MAEGDAAQLAKDKLESAIREYHETVEPDVFVHAYVLVTHKETVETYRENASAVGYLVPTGQSWPITVGMLVTASDSARGVHTR